MPAPVHAEATAAITCRDLVIRYGDRAAVDGVSFEANRGEVLALLGPNGAGKTSTVETLEGYRRPTSGQVRVLGLDPVADRRALVPRLGVMLQRGGTYPIMGPERALRLFASYYEDPADPGWLLDLVGLRQVARTPFRQLSGGEQQRLALALALVGRPDVALLDEPTAGVDPAGRQVVRRVVADLSASDACVVVTTHDLAEAELWANRVLVLREGVIAAEGPPTTLRAAGAGPEGPTLLRFSTGTQLDADALAGAIGALVQDEGHRRYRVAAPSTPALVAAVTAWLAEHEVPLTELRSGATLEEAYLAIVGPAGPDADRSASRAGPDPQMPDANARRRRPGARRRRSGDRGRRP